MRLPSRRHRATQTGELHSGAASPQTQDAVGRKAGANGRSNRIAELLDRGLNTEAVGIVLDLELRTARLETENRYVTENLSMAAANGYLNSVAAMPSPGAYTPVVEPRPAPHWGHGRPMGVSIKLFWLTMGTALVAGIILVADFRGSPSHIWNVPDCVAVTKQRAKYHTPGTSNQQTTERDRY
jgi:hypothetical protein